MPRVIIKLETGNLHLGTFLPKNTMVEPWYVLVGIDSQVVDKMGEHAPEPQSTVSYISATSLRSPVSQILLSERYEMKLT